MYNFRKFYQTLKTYIKNYTVHKMEPMEQMSQGLTYTLIFIKNNNQVLLGLKKRGFAVNVWNGFGGKVEPGEDIESSAIRELEEESRLVVTKLNYIGVLAYQQTRLSQISMIHIFTSNKYVGEPMETEEMKPQWFNIDELPPNMWPDNRCWYPYMWKDKYFYVHVTYNENDQYESCHLTECPDINEVLVMVRKVESTLI